ncbi:undecaprenyl-phosphate glucose phosphotransferase [Noviherbaspirillum sedimenti]|uniref:Undecaprenyl-phosphate glucose phosphotransferase n=1 Tax=Noviherbaspirillum sedimenti TaxID=2320865 RepID=A0A3A3GFP8_9BURK|nr:undecaprenyl-phosphate glucose phosphotransferase [Noviherbaspirillum sedimenti]RJG01086.1 undecaprenyl-phosphate glucose phosphotransferase [Noviherbaspirillum sedimenti]
MRDILIDNSSRLEFSMRLVDVFAIVGAANLAGAMHFLGPLDSVAPIHPMLMYFCGALAFFLFPLLGVYASWRGRPMLTMTGQLAAAWAAILLIGLFFSFLIHHAGNVSRIWMFYWYFVGLVLLVCYRLLLYSTLRLLRKMGLNNKRVVIVGYGITGQEMHRRAQQQDWYGYDVSGIHVDEQDAHQLRDPAIDRIDNLEDIPEYVLKKQIHEIWITLPLAASAKMQQLQHLLRNALVDIRWVPDTIGLHMLSNRMIDFLGVTAIDLNCPVSSGVGGLFKAIFDRMFALVTLILLIPLFIVLAIGIKISSPGPVFFKQPRLGLNGKKIDVYKFRSMKVHLETGVVTQASRNDPRVTPFGHFLRRTSLDELPQFINVLRGDMSVVGPRPHALQHNDKYKDLLELYMLRHRVKPGITGWAQIHGHRGETDTVEKMRKRLQFDLYYIRNWSFLMDMKIIIWTTFKGWSGNNAY